jgi:hypothetical protein
LNVQELPLTEDGLINLLTKQLVVDAKDALMEADVPESLKIAHKFWANPPRDGGDFNPDPSLEKNSLTKPPLAKAQKSSCKTLDL